MNAAMVSPVADRVLECLRSRPLDAPSCIVAEIQGGSDPLSILAGLQDHAVSLAGDLRPLVLLDAVWDLLPAFGADAALLLVPAADWIRRFEPRKLHPEWLETAPPQESPVIWLGSLDEALEAEDVRGAGAVVARMRAVLRDESYLYELMIEAAARDPKPPGWTLIGVHAVVRALAARDQSRGRPFLFRAIEALHGAGISPMVRAEMGEPPSLPIVSAFRAAAETAADPPTAFLHLAHAWQADRACRLRGRQYRRALAPVLESWYPGSGARHGEERSMPAGVSVPIDPEKGTRLTAQIVRGEVDQALGEIGSLLSCSGDPDPLFRWIAGAALPRLEAGDPMPLLLANGARWGLHISGSEEPVLLRRLVEHLAAGRRVKS